MSLLVIGLSHRSAPIPLLERAALPPERVAKLIGDAVGTEHVLEAIAVATCNRLEVYTDVTRFHGALTDLSALISLHTGVAAEELHEHLYVHYDNRAAQHLFNVACGLDSMVVGEPQVLGQLRSALATGQSEGTVGRVLNDLAQTALRVGKRAHSETGLDREGQSLVTAALDLAAPLLDGGRPARPSSSVRARCPRWPPRRSPGSTQDSTSRWSTARRTGPAGSPGRSAAARSDWSGWPRAWPAPIWSSRAPAPSTR